MSILKCMRGCEREEFLPVVNISIISTTWRCFAQHILLYVGIYIESSRVGLMLLADRWTVIKCFPHQSKCRSLRRRWPCVNVLCCCFACCIYTCYCNFRLDADGNRCAFDHAVSFFHSFFLFFGLRNNENTTGKKKRIVYYDKNKIIAPSPPEKKGFCGYFRPIMTGATTIAARFIFRYSASKNKIGQRWGITIDTYLIRRRPRWNDRASPHCRAPFVWISLDSCCCCCCTWMRKALGKERERERKLAISWNTQSHGGHCQYKLCVRNE